MTELATTQPNQGKKPIYEYKTYPARDFLFRDTMDLFRMQQEDFFLLFDDGNTVLTNERDVLFSHFFWEYQRRYERTPLLPHHLVTNQKVGGAIKNNAHIGLITKCFWDAFDAHAALAEDPLQLLDDLSRLYYETSNAAYNFLSVKCAPWRTTVSVLDFIQIGAAPDVIERLKKTEPTEEGIAGANQYLLDLIRNDPRFKGNMLAAAVRAGITREGQLLQILGHRGFIQDISGRIFRYPVMSNYLWGIRTIHDSAIESRSAARALANSDTPLKNTEYFSRRQQLICFSVRHLHWGDCGSTKYLRWLVRDKVMRGGNVVRNNDLDALVGKYYLDEETNKLKVVRASDKHLIGKTILLRSIVAGCQHPDPYGVCMTCLGEAGYALPKGANLGHSFCVSMTSIMGQAVLSTKHLEMSASIEKIHLGATEKAYLKTDSSGNAFLFSEKLKSKKNLRFFIHVRTAPGLTDIRNIEDLRTINLQSASEFDKIKVTYDEVRGENSVFLDVYVNDRFASLSREMLAHIRKVGTRVTDDGTDLYEISLEGWDFSQVAFVLPYSHFNMADHQKAIATCIESMKAANEKRIRYVSPEDKIVELQELVNKRLGSPINLSVLEVMAYAHMVVDSTEGNYDLPKAWTKRNYGAMRAVMMGRSLAAQMAFQGHRQTFLNPMSFTQTNRQDHVYDGLLMPQIFNDDPYGEFLND